MLCFVVKVGTLGTFIHCSLVSTIRQAMIYHVPNSNAETKPTLLTLATRAPVPATNAKKRATISNATNPAPQAENLTIFRKLGTKKKSGPQKANLCFH